MSDSIRRRRDVDPERGRCESGDEDSADPVDHRYPIDTAKQVRAAWSYINHRDSAAKYSPDEVARIKSRIRRAAKTHGVEISPESTRSSREGPGPRDGRQA